MCNLFVKIIELIVGVLTSSGKTVIPCVYSFLKCTYAKESTEYLYSNRSSPDGIEIKNISELDQRLRTSYANLRNRKGELYK